MYGMGDSCNSYFHFWKNKSEVILHSHLCSDANFLYEEWHVNFDHYLY